MDIYFEVLTNDGDFYCLGNTREKHLERTLAANPDATVIVRNRETHEIMVDEQPLSKVCKPYNQSNVNQVSHEPII